MSKSADAFRTISEVAEWLGVHAHVLRFWESKFSQIKPIKRAGGRRYYRPVDMLLLGGIQKLLHEDGLTIKGVQKILREKGMAHVSALSKSLDDHDTIIPSPISASDSKAATPTATVIDEAPSAMDVPQSDDPGATVLAFMTGDAEEDTDQADPDKLRPSFTEDAVVMPEKPQSDTKAKSDADLSTTHEDVEAAVVEPQAAPPADAPIPVSPFGQTPEFSEAEAPTSEPVEQSTSDQPEAPKGEVAETEDAPELTALEATEAQDTAVPEPVSEDVSKAEAEDVSVDADEPAMPLFSSASAKTEDTTEASDITEEPTPRAEPEPDAQPEPAAAALPSFMHRRPTDQPEPDDTKVEAEAVETETVETEAVETSPAPKPLIIDVPETPDENSFDAHASLLGTMGNTKSLSAQKAAAARPLLAQLVAAHDRMAQAHKE